MEVTTRITNAAGQIRDRLVAELRRDGWAVSAGSDPIGLDGAAVVMVERGEALHLFEELIRRGMMAQSDLSPGALAAVLKSRHKLVLLAADTGPVTRWELRWTGQGHPSRISKLLTPAIVDLRVVSLPGWLWWAYWVVRPLRIAFDRTTRRGPRPSAPFLGTPMNLVRPLLDLVSPRRDEVVADLGCGDGRVLIQAARLYGCRGVGIESDPRLVEVARRAIRNAGLERRISIIEGDLIEADVDGCRVVFMFLPTGQVARMLVDLLNRLGPGTAVVAHEQSPADWPVEPDETHLILDEAGVTVGYAWRT